MLHPKFPSIFVGLWFFAFWGLSQSGAVADTLVVSPEMAYLSLDPYLEMTRARGPQPPLDEVEGRPFQAVKGRVSLGFIQDAYWFRFRLENKKAEPLNLYLDIEFPQLDLIQLYPPGQAPLTLGDAQPYGQRPLKTQDFVIPVTVPPGRSTWHLLVQTTSSFSVPIAISSSSKLVEHLNQKQLGIGIFYGIAIALMLYNFSLFFGTREVTHGLFVLFIFHAIGYCSMMDGIGFSFWPNLLYWQGRAVLFFVAGMMIFTSQFARYYLETMDQHQLLDRTNLALVSGWLILIPVFLVAPLHICTRILTLLVMITLLAQVFVGVVRLVQGSRMALYYLLAWSGMLITGTAVAMAAKGLIPGFHILSIFGIKIALAAVMLLLSIGQAHRIRVMMAVRERDREQLIRVQAESDARSAFLARMSHELRTPMNAVLGIVDLVCASQLTTKQRSMLEVVTMSGKSLLMIIDDILQFSRLEANKTSLHLVPFDLEKLLDSTLQMFVLGHSKPGVALTYKLEPGTPQFLIGDASRLTQIIVNLMGNAMKFTSQGEVCLRAGRRRSEGDLELIWIEVRDTGIGISDEAQANLFLPFSQADVSTTREFGGTGLGLSICRQLVHLMGGDIELESQLGVGSRFIFTFQARVAQTPEKPVESALGATSEPSLTHLRVLVAEDNQVNRMVVLGYLKRMGLRAIVAADGLEAVRCFKEATTGWDLVLMDCEMPNLDGFQATLQIRQYEAERGQRPCAIVALTAHALPEYREKALASGMDDYLTKPILWQSFNQFMTRRFGNRVEHESS